MKCTKTILKVFTFLTLLLLSSNTSSFPIPAHPDWDKQITLTTTLEQADHELSDFDISSAPTPQFFQKKFCDAILFRLTSERLEVKDSIYLKLSAEIVPGLDIPRLIFPFHYFF